MALQTMTATHGLPREAGATTLTSDRLEASETPLREAFAMLEALAMHAICLVSQGETKTLQV